MARSDIMESIRSQIDRIEQGGEEPVVCAAAPDVYARIASEAATHSFDPTTVMDALQDGRRGMIYGIPLYLSEHMPKGTFMVLPKMQTLEGMARFGLGAADAADKLGRGMAALGTTMQDVIDGLANLAGAGLPIGPALPALKGPFSKIRQIDHGTLRAFDADGEYLMTLTREGAAWLVETYPQVTWGV